MLDSGFDIVCRNGVPNISKHEVYTSPDAWGYK